MPEQYFTIPLGNHPSLVEAQNLLRRAMPEMQFVDPATFHVTLVYIEDTNGANLSEGNATPDLPLFGIGSWGIDAFATDQGYAINLRMERSPQLTYLQSALYYKAVGAGAKIGEYSYPARFRPHITLAYAPDEPQYYDYGTVHLEIDRYILSGPEYTPIAEWLLQTEVRVQEMVGDNRLHILESAKVQDGRTCVTLNCFSEMKGTYPDIPLNGVDLTAIKAELNDPKFVTIPIGQVDARSNNQRTYRRSAVEKLVAQINTNRPEGTWGHTKSEDMGTEYQLPAIRWLGAAIDDNGIAWGKGLPTTNESQKHFKIAKATNARVGTSLQAWVDMDGEDVLDMELIKLDLADPSRVGVPITAALPHLSAEMVEEGVQERQRTSSADATGGAADGEQSPSIVQVHKEHPMEPKVSTDKLPDAVPEVANESIKTLKQQVRELHTQLDENREKLADFNDIMELLGNPKDSVIAVRALQAERDDTRRENIALLAEAITSQVAAKVAIEDRRPMVEELVRKEKPTTRNEVVRVLDTVLNQDYVKILLKSGLVEQSGPPQHAMVGDAGKKPTGEWFENPELK